RHEATRDPRTGGRDHEGRHFVARGIDADRRRRDFVFAQRSQRATPATELDSPSHDTEQKDDPEDPKRTGVERNALIPNALIAILAAEGREDPVARRSRRNRKTEDLCEAERD